MNDDTYEEVTTFKLSRLSVYIMLSTIFVVLVGLTVALIVFTPLKYYIPGTNTDYKSAMESRKLKYSIDSLAKEDEKKARYIDGIKKALSGNSEMMRDTTRLELPKTEETND
jgi:hypothetical protein